MAVTAPCLNPWLQMVVDATSGIVVPCCFWQGENCGDVRKTSLLEIWNSRVYQKLRSNMATGRPPCGCRNCFALKQKANLEDFYYDPAVDAEEPPTSPYARNIALLRREITEGKSRLAARPLKLSMTLTHACNIRCLHCYQEKNRDVPLSRESIYDETVALTDTLAQLIIGGGEPFAEPRWRRFFREWHKESNPYLHIGVTTNATLVDEEILAALDRFRHLVISVSFDAGSRDVYEKVRYGSNFDRVIENIQKLKALVRKRELPSTCGVTMCVMKSNIHDLKNYLLRCRELVISGGLYPVEGPAHESIACFNNAAKELAGWKKVFAEARALLTDDFLRPMYEASKDTIRSNFREAYLPFLDALENSIPWHVAELPAFEVNGRFPEHVWRKFSHLRAPQNSSIRDAYHKNPVVVLFPASEGFRVCRYYADIREDGSWTAHLPEGRYRFGIVRPMDLLTSQTPDLHLVVRKNSDGKTGTGTFDKKIIPSAARIKQLTPAPLRPILQEFYYKLMQ